MSQAAFSIDGRACSEQDFYQRACDPQRHVVVQACAGAGKTWMLVSRMLRALLTGAKPGEILAITFTKKAAGEMRGRLRDWLRDFSCASDEILKKELAIRGLQFDPGDVGTEGSRQALVRLYRESLSQAQGVQIRTFHSWFGSLLQGAPLAMMEAMRLPAAYELIEDDKEIIDAVWPRFYRMLQGEPVLGAVYAKAVRQVGRHGLHEALSHALQKRVEFELADEAGRVESCVKPLAEVMPAFADCQEPLSMISAGREVLQQASLTLGQATQKTYRDWSAELEMALRTEDWAIAQKVLLTDRAQARVLRWPLAGLEHVTRAQALCLQVQAALEHQAAFDHHRNMLLLMRALCRCFADLKRANAWIDMGDLERAALTMLRDDQVSGWVMQRLDARVGHLLVDEFQDTSPIQWQALQSWLSSYAGAGGGQARAPRIFIVGDAKQSIYRFRRAEPQVFAAASRFVCEGLQGSLLACDHTRRNAPEIVNVVNAVMAQAAQDGAYPFRAHTTGSEKPGVVLRLPLAPLPQKGSEASKALIWRRSLIQQRDDPDERAVDTECALAARWIASEIAKAERPRDFMVLARKRDRLGRMRDALRELHIPAQVTENEPMTSLAEVRDVLALVEALLLPGHDLALAQALRSPIFGFTDDDLIALAIDRRSKGADSSWLACLMERESLAPIASGIRCTQLTTCAADLRQCQAWLQELPPHDALSRIFQRLEVVERMAAAAPPALRPRVVGSLHAVLQHALNAQGGRFLTPHAWMEAIKSPHLSAPQASNSEAVQLLTVHGAKGLESDTVLLLDCNSAPSTGSQLDVLVDWPGEADAPTVFAFLLKETRIPMGLQNAMAHEKKQRDREEINALYVAMTRAKSRLVISGHDTLKIHENNPWWRLHAAGELVQDVVADDFSSFAPSGPTSAAQNTFSLPALPALPTVSAQTTASARITRASERPVQSESSAPLHGSAHEAPGQAARVGSCMHRLLELYRPGLDVAAMAPSVGSLFGLDATQTAHALTAAERILTGEAAWAWDPDQLAWQGNEVELLCGGQALRVDRLVLKRDSLEWWVLDFKSGENPQKDRALCQQLTRYLQVVQKAHPAHKVRAAFLTPSGSLKELVRGDAGL